MVQSQFAKIAQPLYNLTKKGASFYRTAVCEAAFDYLKSCLITAPIQISTGILC